MKVLFLSIVPSPYQRDLFVALNQREDIEIEVLYAEAGSHDSPWPEKDLHSYERISKSITLHWGSNYFIINRQLPSVDDFDAVVINGYVTIPAQWIMRTSFRKLPLVFWGEKLECGKGGLREKIQRLLIRPMRKLSAIVAIGQKAEGDYKRRFPSMPIFRIPYLCDLKPFQSNIPHRPRDPITFLFCGQMIFRKGIDLLLEAFSRIIESGLEANLLLVGWEKDLEQMMNGIPESTRARIHNAGFQSPEALPKYFSQADIFVLPSRYDGWGVVVNQALGAGLPVICSDAVGSAEDLVESGKNGYIFSSGKVDELENVMTRFIKSPDCIAKFAENSLKRAESLSPEQGAEDWVCVLKEVIEKWEVK